MTPPAATAAARAPHARAVPRPAPRPRPRPAATVRAPQGRAALVRQPRPVPLGPLPGAVGRTAGVVLRLPDQPLIHRLTRGRWWIGVVGSLLAGIVALNVFTLSLSAGSGKRSEQIEQLQSSNSELASRLARRTSADALQKHAAGIGMIVPEPGEIRYLTPQGRSDLKRAAERLSGSPDQTAASAAPAGGTPAAVQPAAQVPNPAATPPQPQQAQTPVAAPTTTTDPATRAPAAAGAVAAPPATTP